MQVVSRGTFTASLEAWRPRKPECTLYTRARLAAQIALPVLILIITCCYGCQSDNYPGECSSCDQFLLLLLLLVILSFLCTRQQWPGNLHTAGSAHLVVGHRQGYEHTIGA